MAVPMNPTFWQIHTSIASLEDARKHIDSFPRPTGFNAYAWSTTKKLALSVWRCHFEGRTFNRTLNYLHPSFYEMIRTPEGVSIVHENALRRLRTVA